MFCFMLKIKGEDKFRVRVSYAKITFCLVMVKCNKKFTLICRFTVKVSFITLADPEFIGRGWGGAE